MIYLVIFFFSLCLYKIASILKQNLINKIFKYSIVIVGLALPCLLAALRADSVGTDMNVYIKPSFLIAEKSNNFNEYYTISKSFGLTDIIYLLTNYISAKVFNEFKITLFIMQFLVVYPIYKTLTMINKKNTLLYGMFIFYFYMFNTSLNMLRQSISMSFEILSICYLLKRSYIKTIFTFFIALGFHRMVILSFPIYWIYILYKSCYFSFTTKTFIKNSILLGSLLLILFLNKVIAIISNVGLFDYKILSQVSLFQRSFHIPLTYCVLFTFVIFILVKNKKIVLSFINNYTLYLFIVIMGIILVQIGGYFSYGERISYFYLYPFLIIALPQIMERSRNSKMLCVCVSLFFIGYT